MKTDSFAVMMAEVVAFHDKHAFNKNGGGGSQGDLPRHKNKPDNNE